MEKPSVLIKYDGGDATSHAIDAKLLGQSLQGIDRIVSDCIVIFSAQRLPKRGERASLILKVKEPEQGSYAIPGLPQEVSEALAFGVPIMQAIGPEILSYYVKAVLDFFRGKDDAVELAIKKMAEMHETALNAVMHSQNGALKTIEKMDERRHEEYMAMHDLLRLAISSSGSAAVDYVAPVGRGRSVDTASFRSGSGKAFVIDGEDAETIRDSQKMEWHSIGNETFKTDGFKYHSSALSIENPERDGYMMADVVDPAFEDEANSYTFAAQKRAKIEVLARKGYKNGKLTKIQILDFVKEVEDSI